MTGPDMDDNAVVVDEDEDALGVVVRDGGRPRRGHLHGHVGPLLGDGRRRLRRRHAHQLRPRRLPGDRSAHLAGWLLDELLSLASSS